MKAIRSLLACIRQADQKYNLFEKGDKVVVGISGGKDSLALLYCLSIYQKFEHTKFQIQPVLLDLGFPNSNFDKIKQFCQSLGYELIIEDNKNVYQILKIQQEKQKLKHLPCSICSRMKKASIDKVAKKIKFNKVAFAHHLDDAIETFFMNMLYSAKVSTFSPKMLLDKDDITFIRPFCLVNENDIKKLIKEENIPILTSLCPADKNTTREEIKVLLNDIYKQFPSAKKNFLTLLNDPKEDLWNYHIEKQINQKGLVIKPVFTKADYIEEIKIRHDIFIKEENISFKDEFVVFEENYQSYLILLKNKIIGTFRLKLFEEQKRIYIQRFAIKKRYRNKGYGSQVLQYLIKYIKHFYNPITICLHSQYRYRNLYLKYNFKCVGKPFYEAKIKHILMELNV